MRSKWTIKFKSEPFQHDYRNKLIKTLKKLISCKYECKFDSRICNSNQTITAGTRISKKKKNLSLDYKSKKR